MWKIQNSPCTFPNIYAIKTIPTSQQQSPISLPNPDPTLQSPQTLTIPKLLTFRWGCPPPGASPPPCCCHRFLPLSVDAGAVLRLTGVLRCRGDDVVVMVDHGAGRTRALAGRLVTALRRRKTRGIRGV